ncbi:DUF3037 domain-containing protein [Pandoraea apista]|uniref:DUF3037 domain-containing protein n=2 Tax=Pandoraea apista TaxID=93218 RepID=A0ABX9ZKP3_9BURK|nr:hypothetical protein B7H01_17115 [Pandoraea apista]PTE00849.1 DUF3037 domain-containing protein [Pandoraea apista]RRJ30812.1 DUF3037 domain-containing protein [Pandoraea apista]RRJ74561.1 DUF3037 domain-containing protein [Pandoraea apista]RSD06404.1 DUF3037 domain-containing protein [Pandoraea apista]
MDMTKFYEYVVLRLAPDAIRGESINVGLAIFPQDESPVTRISASLAKVRQLDASWNSSRADRFRDAVQEIIVDQNRSIDERISLLAALGYCLPGEPGFFYASPSTLAEEIRLVEAQYITAKNEPNRRAPRSKLHQEIAQRFKSMKLLGKTADDLLDHLVVPHVAIPGTPDLKADFVYKNGVYRITQTLDYRVSSQGARQKIAEACTKVTAAQQGQKVWGDTTMKFALVCVPGEVADIADSHLDLLYASGFKIFHADKPKELASYHAEAFAH